MTDDLKSAAEATLRLDEVYHFRSSHWLELAMTHKSHSNEKKALQAAMLVNGAITAGEVTSKNQSPEREPPDDNERLEFLGDSVLSASLSARLVREFPFDPEGTLSKRRASMVNEERLAAIARRLRLDQMLKLGKGEIKTGGATKPRILACGFEALIGAIFLDSGFAEADRAIGILFSDEIDRLKNTNLEFERDYKTRLQEHCHAQYGVTPTYDLVEEFGPAHARGFRVVARVGANVLGTGEGKSKKAAEQEAARSAFEKIGTKVDPNNESDGL